MLSTPPNIFQLLPARRENGRMCPNYRKGATFTSVRYPQDIGRELSTKTIQVIPLAKMEVSWGEYHTTPDWDYLPEELRRIFEGGERLQTIGECCAQGKDTEFSLLMVTNPTPFTNKQGKRQLEGRTGTVFFGGHPIVRAIDGKDFLLEAKGLGSAVGGYDYHERQSGFSVTGGLLKRGAVLEYRNLEQNRESSSSFQEGEEVRASACFVFPNPDPKIKEMTDEFECRYPDAGDEKYMYDDEYDRRVAHYVRVKPLLHLGILFRWSPSVIRASYDPQKKHVGFLGGHLARLIFSGIPSVHLSPHLENLLVWGGNGSGFQDAADIRRYDHDDYCYAGSSKICPDQFYYELKRQLVEHIFDRQFRVLQALGIVSDKNGFFDLFRDGFLSSLQRFTSTSDDFVAKLIGSTDSDEFITFIIEQVKERIGNLVSCR